MGPAVLLAQFESRYADVIVNDTNVIIMAKRFLDKVETVRYDNTFTDTPTKVKEVLVFVDNSRAGVYKGDTVNLDSRDFMTEVDQFNKICNGVEMHVVLTPGGGSFLEAPERFVIGISDASQTECTMAANGIAYTVKHVVDSDLPNPIAEEEPSVGTLPSVAGPNLLHQQPYSKREVDAPNAELMEQQLDTQFPEKPFVKQESPKYRKQKKQLSESCQLSPELFEMLEAHMKMSDFGEELGEDKLGEQQSPKQKHPSPHRQRRRSVSHQQMNSEAPPGWFSQMQRQQSEESAQSSAYSFQSEPVHQPHHLEQASPQRQRRRSVS